MADEDDAAFLAARGGEPVLLWYAEHGKDPRDSPQGRMGFTLVEALRHLAGSPLIYQFDIDMSEGARERLGSEKVRSLMQLV